MRSVFGVFWDEMPEEEKHKAVTLWYRTESEEQTRAKASERWALDENAASKFAERAPEDGYCSLSLKAFGACCLRWRVELATAHPPGALPGRLSREPKELLPLVQEAVPSLRNPAVERALTEVTKGG